MALTPSPFGRQLDPVTVIVTGGLQADRVHWRNKINAYLSNQACVTNTFSIGDTEIIRVHPDANND
jgi:hypothetical protein